MYNHVNLASAIRPEARRLNDIDVKTPPEVVWKLLVDATNWSSNLRPRIGRNPERWTLPLSTKFHRVRAHRASRWPFRLRESSETLVLYRTRPRSTEPTCKLTVGRLRYSTNVSGQRP